MQLSGCHPTAKPTENNFEKSNPDLETENPSTSTGSSTQPDKMPQEIGDIKKVRFEDLSFYAQSGRHADIFGVVHRDLPAEGRFLYVPHEMTDELGDGIWRL